MDLIYFAPLLRDVVTYKAQAEQARGTLRSIYAAMEALRANATEARSRVTRAIAAAANRKWESVAATEESRLLLEVERVESVKLVSLEIEAATAEETIDAFDRAMEAAANLVTASPLTRRSACFVCSLPAVATAVLATPPARGPVETSGIEFIATPWAADSLGKVTTHIIPTIHDVWFAWSDIPSRVLPGHPIRVKVGLKRAFRNKLRCREDAAAALASLRNSLRISLTIAESHENLPVATLFPVRADIFPETVEVDTIYLRINFSIATPTDLPTTHESGWELAITGAHVGQDRVDSEAGLPIRILIGASHAPCVSLGTLSEAAKAGDVFGVVKALSEGSSTEEVDPHGLRPLHHAAAGKSPEAVRVLLAAGAWVNSRDYAGRTPLHWAALGLTNNVISTLLATPGVDAWAMCWSSAEKKRHYDEGNSDSQKPMTPYAVAVARDPLGRRGVSASAIRAHWDFNTALEDILPQPSGASVARRTDNHGLCKKPCCSQAKLLLRPPPSSRDEEGFPSWRIFEPPEGFYHYDWPRRDDHWALSQAPVRVNGYESMGKSTLMNLISSLPIMFSHASLSCQPQWDSIFSDFKVNGRRATQAASESGRIVESPSRRGALRALRTMIQGEVFRQAQQVPTMEKRHAGVAARVGRRQ